jgi:hypothetical protein
MHLLVLFHVMYHQCMVVNHLKIVKFLFTEIFLGCSAVSVMG